MAKLKVTNIELSDLKTIGAYSAAALAVIVTAIVGSQHKDYFKTPEEIMATVESDSVDSIDNSELNVLIEARKNIEIYNKIQEIAKKEDRTIVKKDYGIINMVNVKTDIERYEELTKPLKGLKESEKVELELLLQRITGEDATLVGEKVVEGRDKQYDVFKEQLRREFARVNNIPINELSHVYVSYDYLPLDDRVAQDMGFYLDWNGKSIRLDISSSHKNDLYYVSTSVGYSSSVESAIKDSELLEHVIKENMIFGIKDSNELTAKEIRKLEESEVEENKGFRF